MRFPLLSIDFIKALSPQKRMAVLAGFLVLLALPLTIIAGRQQQITQQNASGSCTPGDEKKVDSDTIVGCHGGVWDDPSTRSVDCVGGSYQIVGTKPDGTPDYSCIKTPPAGAGNPGQGTTSPVGGNATATTVPPPPPNSQNSQTVVNGTMQPVSQSGPAAVSTSNVTGKDNDSCSSSTPPKYEANANGDFSYCVGNKLHVGACTGGNIPQPGGINGIVCRTPSYVAANKTTTPPPPPPAAVTNGTRQPANSTTSSTAVAVSNVTGKDNDSCSSSTPPKYEANPNGDFSYCLGNKLHVGACTGGNIPQPGGTNGITCKTPSYVAENKPLVKSPDIIAEKTPTPTHTPTPTPTPTPNASVDCYDTPGQTCVAALDNPVPGVGTCEKAMKSTNTILHCVKAPVDKCGVQVPPDFAEKVHAQSNTYSSTPSDYSSAAQAAGYDDATIVQSGALGNPYLLPTDSNPLMSTYTGCLWADENYGPEFQGANICYKNGQEIYNEQIPYGHIYDPEYNLVKVIADQLGPECVPGGYVAAWFDPSSPQYVGNHSSSTQVGNSVAGQTIDAPLSNDVGDKNTTLGLDVGLSGFADTTNTSTPVKDFVVTLLDPQNRVVGSKKTRLKFNSKTKSFQGKADVSGLTQNTEGLKVSVDTAGYFPTSTNTIPVAANADNNISIPNVPAGDIVGDGGSQPNILDYNVFVSCSVFSKDGGATCKDSSGNSLKAAADLNGDGKVDQDDYTILLKSWKLLQGKNSR